MDEIVSGIDELGVLLLGHARGAYWYGSQLSIEEARKLVPHNNATRPSGLRRRFWAASSGAVENPKRGVVEPDEMDFERVLESRVPISAR
jgi:homospermidine synthase